MGSCISKFNSNKKEAENFVQDKLVIISQPPISCNNNIPPKPSSPSLSPTSTSSFSSFYHSTSTNTISSSSNVPLWSPSSSSCSSSVVFSKDRPTTFSNDFLRSCVTQNPQITSCNCKDPVKAGYRFDQNPKFDKLSYNTSTPQVTKAIVASPRRYTNTPKKRSRANSPNLTRQKSLRRDLPDMRPNTPSRIMRSQSPARRFSSDNYSYRSTMINQMTPIDTHRQPLDSKGNSWIENGGGKENVRHITSNTRTNVFSKNYGRIGENYSHHFQQELPADQQDVNSILMDDVNNPHIALDCFIFL